MCQYILTYLSLVSCNSQIRNTHQYDHNSVNGKKNDAANFQINTGSDDDSKDGNDSTSLFRFVTVNPKKTK